MINNEITAPQRIVYRRNVELSRLHNDNKCLGENLLDDIPPLSIGTFSEECINCGTWYYFCYVLA